MPLRHIDPTKRRSVVTRGLNRAARTRFGLFVGKHLASRTDPWLSRISGGRISWGVFNVPSATLRTDGAKSGRIREAQVAYFHDGRDAIVMASNYGGAKHPQWYHNLRANPECELGGEPFRAHEVIDPDDYGRLYGVAENYYGGFADYRESAARTGRTVPVFRLIPR